MCCKLTCNVLKNCVTNDKSLASDDSDKLEIKSIKLLSDYCKQMNKKYISAVGSIHKLIQTFKNKENASKSTCTTYHDSKFLNF